MVNTIPDKNNRTTNTPNPNTVESPISSLTNSLFEVIAKAEKWRNPDTYKKPGFFIAGEP